jgi:LPXTG-motif cell wall-anchored protein
MVVAVGAMVVGVVAMWSPAITVNAQSVDAPTVAGASPLSGPVGGGTVVTMTGSGFQRGVTEVMVVLTGGGWMREIPASAMTIDADGTTMSFAMPEGPVGGGVAGLVAFVPGKQAANVPTWTYAQLAVTGASPLSGPASGGTVVTMTGSGFQPGVTEVMVVFTGGLWRQEIPASAMTINADETTMSFAMPESPAGAGAAGLVAFVPGIQAQFVPTFTYEPATMPRQRVADDGAASSGETDPDLTALPATGDGTGVLLALATGAVMMGVGLLVLARRRSGR